MWGSIFPHALVSGIRVLLSHALRLRYQGFMQPEGSKGLHTRIRYISPTNGSIAIPKPSPNLSQFKHTLFVQITVLC